MSCLHFYIISRLLWDHSQTCSWISTTLYWMLSGNCDYLHFNKLINPIYIWNYVSLWIFATEVWCWPNISIHRCFKSRVALVWGSSKRMLIKNHYQWYKSEWEIIKQSVYWSESISMLFLLTHCVRYTMYQFPFQKQQLKWNENIEPVLRTYF